MFRSTPAPDAERPRVSTFGSRSGVRAADVNAGFVAERLARRAAGVQDAAALWRRARRHYEAALSQPRTNATRLIRPARRLEEAEARRALGACWADGWRGACVPGTCDASEAPDSSEDGAGDDDARSCPATARPAARDGLWLEAAAGGSEWAALDEALRAYRAGAPRRATVLAADCAAKHAWPHRTPCAIVAFGLSARAFVLDFAWWRRLLDRDRDAPLTVLLAEFGSEREELLRGL